MRTLLFFGAFLMFFPCAAWAQRKGRVEVVKDPLIEILQAHRISLLRTGASPGEESARGTPVDRSNMTRTTARGFRVQIFLGPDRREAYATQARFQQLFKDIDTYITYEAPNYRVKVGDFRSRSEAERLMQGLRDQFSNVFVFTEDIFIYQ